MEHEIGFFDLYTRYAENSLILQRLQKMSFRLYNCTSTDNIHVGFNCCTSHKQDDLFLLPFYVHFHAKIIL